MRNLSTRLFVLAAASVLCATAQAQLSNQDDCANSGVDNIGVGIHPFDTSFATTGLEGQADCLASGSTVVDNDVWFTYTAGSTGMAVLSTCSASGTHTDTKIVAYPGAPACPLNGSMIGCNDDSCGFLSELSFPVTSGTSYVIQFGSFPGAAGGTGDLAITEIGPVTNDECTGAIPLALGSVAFSTMGASTSAPPWPCAAGGNDIWYSFVAPNNATYVFDTCLGASYDTALELFTGSCGALASVACNDDACGLRSTVQALGANAGDQFFLRVGGFAASTGTGTLTVNEFPPPPPCNGLMTLYAANNFGSVGGAIYFDLTMVATINISAIQTNYAVGAGTPVGIEVWTTPGTHMGNENNPAAVWTMVGVDDGSGVAAGTNNPSHINLVAPVSLNAGTIGVALVAVGSGHTYTNGNGANQTYSDVIVTLNAGTATSVPFTGNVFSPRVWNGELCYAGSGSIGPNYCGPAVPNSTGVPGIVSAVGSPFVSANDVTLTADDLPPLQFGYFLNSQAQGLFMPPVSNGWLCLGGAIGRHNQPGLVGQGRSFSITLDLNMLPLQNGGFTSVQPGDTYNFTSWYRDVGNTNNFTDAVSVTFL